MTEKNYDSTIMRIAGNLLSGQAIELTTGGYSNEALQEMAAQAVRLARAIVAEVQSSALPEPPR